MQPSLKPLKVLKVKAGTCNRCNNGKVYKNLNQHITKMHNHMTIDIVEWGIITVDGGERNENCGNGSDGEMTCLIFHFEHNGKIYELHQWKNGDVDVLNFGKRKSENTYKHNITLTESGKPFDKSKLNTHYNKD